MHGDDTYNVTSQTRRPYTAFCSSLAVIWLLCFFFNLLSQLVTVFTCFNNQRAKLGNVFHVYICPVHYLSHDRPLSLAALMWLSPMLFILFPENKIFVFFNELQIIFKLKPSSMTVLIECNCNNTSWYPFKLYVSNSLKKSSNNDKFMQKFLPFHNQWKIWTDSLHLILRL